MARIRTIKPEFWGDEKMAPLAPIVRLVFLGVISMADDAGRLVDNVKSIDGFIFPESEDSSRDSLDTLARVGRIIRYKSESGQKLIQVANWAKHQKIDKPSKYVLPALAEQSRDTRETLAESPRSDLGPTTYDLVPRITPSTAPVFQVLETDADRAALNDIAEKAPNPDACIASVAAMLQGMGVAKAPTVTQLGEALRDFAANGAVWNAALFRKYVARAVAPASERVGTGRRDEGAAVFAKIRGLVRTNPDPRQGNTRFIPRTEVEKLGPAALRAYEAIGGASRVLAGVQKPETIGFLIREFSDAYTTAQRGAA